MQEVIRLSRSGNNGCKVNITLALKKEIWDEELDGYSLWDDQPFTSDIRLAGYYSEGSHPGESHAGQMLCMLLKQLVCDKKLTSESIIVVEADPSKGDALVKKVYEPMGFESRASSIVETSSPFCGGALMAATVGVISKCHDAQQKCETCERVYGLKQWGQYCTKQCMMDAFTMVKV